MATANLNRALASSEALKAVFDLYSQRCFMAFENIDTFKKCVEYLSWEDSVLATTGPLSVAAPPTHLIEIEKTLVEAEKTFKAMYKISFMTETSRVVHEVSDEYFEKDS
jgi:predicted proteasome-type protease